MMDVGPIKDLMMQDLKEPMLLKVYWNISNLTFGSDWTVAPLKPLQGIYAAVTQENTG